MLHQPPWTNIGSLQGDVDEIKRLLYQKAEAHELRQAAGALDSIECAVREIGATLDGLRTRIEALENQSMNRE
jgi:hypothetical protein